VWAHPFWDLQSTEAALATLRTFIAAGLDGVECFYATHTREQTEALHDAAGGRLTTGSADFHGHGQFSAFRAFELYGLEPNLGPIGARA
jgi:3',5'-nucleoside bisphosphate phosphatase